MGNDPADTVVLSEASVCDFLGLPQRSTRDELAREVLRATNTLERGVDLRPATVYVLSLVAVYLNELAISPWVDLETRVGDGMRVLVPRDRVDLLAVALDLRLTDARVSGHTLRDVLESLRGPVERAVERVLRTLLKTAGEAGVLRFR